MAPPLQWHVDLLRRRWPIAAGPSGGRRRGRRSDAFVLPPCARRRRPLPVPDDPPHPCHRHRLSRTRHGVL